MQNSQVPTSHRAKVAEDIICAASYITMLPAIAALILPRTARNTRVRFHACQSVLLNWMLIAVGFFFHLGAGIDQLLDTGSGVRFEWAFRILCMAFWSLATLSLARGGEFRIPFVASLAQKQANGWLFRRFSKVPVDLPVAHNASLKQAMQLSS
ncbi:MAG: hypothetical protein JST28_02810 [Acidobacteria bacterium]|nr:hypothetical protein [Acidobacteriota bacterium]